MIEVGRSRSEVGTTRNVYQIEETNTFPAPFPTLQTRGLGIRFMTFVPP